MDPFQIFGLQIAMSFLLYTLLARWYVAPRLAARRGAVTPRPTPGR